VNETEEFLASVLPQQKEVEAALHNGDAGPRMAFWSHNDPVTLFGALLNVNGWDEVGHSFEELAKGFSGGSYDYELIASGASGDLGYIAGTEHSTVSVNGEPPEAYELRVTTIFRREDGEWKEVHRHADPMPNSDSARRQLARLDRMLSANLR